MLRPRRTARAGSVLAAALILLIGVSGAHAQAMPQPLAPWSGENPFNCELQDVGFGTDFPDPQADPFCVKFNKTRQNVTDFGLVDFLSQEPARVAAAISKCFYFQSDEWTGSIMQGEQPELWHWVGNYFFDRAKGIGGISVHEFRLGGAPMDATPYSPEAYLPYFDATGGGGALTQLGLPIDPVCGAMVDTPAERERVYGKSGVVARCIAPGGRATRRAIGEARLGMTRAKLRGMLGRPRASSKRADSWCVIGGGSLRATYASGQAVLLRTNNPGQSIRGVARGDRRGEAVRRLGAKPAFRVRRHRVLLASRSTIVIGAYGGKVRWFGVADDRLEERGLKRAVRLSSHLS